MGLSIGLIVGISTGLNWLCGSALDFFGCMPLDLTVVIQNAIKLWASIFCNYLIYAFC